MKVYFVTQKYFGKEVELKPRIPISADKKEGNTPRICVSTSILGALSSIGKNLGLGCKTYIYSCDISEDEYMQPNDNIEDIDMTGELWLLCEKKFILCKIICLNKSDSFEIENNVSIYNFRFVVENNEV